MAKRRPRWQKMLEDCCPECFHAGEDFRELFGLGVVSRDKDSGVAYLMGRPADDTP